METTFKCDDRAPVFWSCMEPERLTLESPEEAIVEMIEGRDRPLADTLAELCPLPVKGYAPDTLDVKWVASLAERAVEMFDETIQDNYGDPDGDSLIEKNKPALTAAIEAAFRAAVADVTPWSCGTVEVRTYDAAEVEAIMRAECPELFDEPEPLPAPAPESKEEE